MATGRRVAMGMKPHVGWAAVVALSGTPAAPQIVAKKRIEMAWTFDEGAVYHKGRELPLARAEALIRSSEERFERLAREALAALVSELRAAGCETVASARIVGEAKALPSLESILRSHPLVHAAEGELYRRVLLRASEAFRIPTRLLPARQLPTLAAAALGVAPRSVVVQLAALGRSSGRPWTKDQKEATLAAWIALAGR